MGLFSKIADKIFHHQTGERSEAAPPHSPALTTPATPPPVTAATAPTAAPAPQPVDVVAVLTAMADLEGGGGNWQTSIVDLLKLLKIDSGLEARKELGEELGVQAGPPGSAEQNIALHKAVMRKLAENGGVVPDSFYS